MVKIAIMGHGTVGSGVVEVLTSHVSSITKRANEEIRIEYILDLRDFPDSPLADRFTKSFDVILNDPEILVVVEVMGGLHPAYDYVKQCLEKGKSVVTSNKELVAAKGAELLKIAQEKNVNFLFEASVGGGIPIIRPMSQCLAANDVIEVAGILNGTTNFILTKMINEDMSFEDALALAQRLGYAERDPSADVDGKYEWEFDKETVSETSDLPDWTQKEMKLTAWNANGTGGFITYRSDQDVVSKEIERVTGVSIDPKTSFDNKGSTVSAKLAQVVMSKKYPDIAYGTHDHQGPYAEIGVELPGRQRRQGGESLWHSVQSRRRGAFHRRRGRRSYQDDALRVSKRLLRLRIGARGYP